jgi:hypothetical protein
MSGSNYNRRLRLMAVRRECCHCGVPLTMETATLEHIVPVVFGGGNGRNLTLACSPCNWERGCSDFLVFRAEMRGEDVSDVLWLNRDWWEGGDVYIAQDRISDETPVPESDEAIAERVASAASRALKALRPVPPKKPRQAAVRPPTPRRGQKFKELLRERKDAKAAKINRVPDRGMASAFRHAWGGPEP